MLTVSSKYNPKCMDYVLEMFLENQKQCWEVCSMKLPWLTSKINWFKKL